MKLWRVTRRAPMRGLDRKVTIWGWAVLAWTAGEAIEIVKRVQGADLIDDAPLLAQYVDGTWSAVVEDTHYVTLRPYMVEPTAADRAAHIPNKRPRQGPKRGLT